MGRIFAGLVGFTVCEDIGDLHIFCGYSNVKICYFCHLYSTVVCQH
jgi:hypothetical protein